MITQQAKALAAKQLSGRIYTLAQQIDNDPACVQLQKELQDLESKVREKREELEQRVYDIAD